MWPLARFSRAPRRHLWLLSGSTDHIPPGLAKAACGVSALQRGAGHDGTRALVGTVDTAQCSGHFLAGAALAAGLGLGRPGSADSGVALRCETTSAATSVSSTASVPHVGLAQIDGNLPNEDRHCLRELGPLLVVAVLHGHGGWQVAEWLSGALLPAIAKHLDGSIAQKGFDYPQTVSAALEAAFAECEAVLLRRAESAASSSKAMRIGACAVCAVVGPAHLFVANAGDCQAMLVRGGQPLRLSTVHNADQPEEQKRLQAAHPGEDDVFVCKNMQMAKVAGGLWGLAQQALGTPVEMKLSACYVKGRLQPTRSFGDFYLKDTRYLCSSNSRGLVTDEV
jgi:serine/threonine protein phosphatase PrpC